MNALHRCLEFLKKKSVMGLAAGFSFMTAFRRWLKRPHQRSGNPRTCPGVYPLVPVIRHGAGIDGIGDAHDPGVGFLLWCMVRRKNVMATVMQVSSWCSHQRSMGDLGLLSAFGPGIDFAGDFPG